MSGRISVNFGAVLAILKRHAPHVMDKTGILSINGIIVDAVIDYMRACGVQFSPEETVAIGTWCPRVGATYRPGAGAKEGE